MKLQRVTYRIVVTIPNFVCKARAKKLMEECIGKVVFLDPYIRVMQMDEITEGPKP